MIALGVDLAVLVERKELELEQMSGRTIAIDASNALYQFLSMIRQRDGTPLMDSKGRVTSHLTGLLYRTARLIEAGVKPVYVFDGKPFEMKKQTLDERREVRDEAGKKWKEALEKGREEEARGFAQASSRLTRDMVEDAKKLLDALGVPFVQAPSEGEAQAAVMAAEGIVWAAASQDYDSLLFGAPILLRNITLSGKRKLPKKDVYVDVHPESIVLEETLAKNGLNRRQLVWVGLLCGTDFNEGAKGIGPKKALALVKKVGSLEELKKQSGYEGEVDLAQVEQFFLNPPAVKADLNFQGPDKQALLKFLVDEHAFSLERVEGTIDKLVKITSETGKQSQLDSWF